MANDRCAVDNLLLVEYTNVGVTHELVISGVEPCFVWDRHSGSRTCQSNCFIGLHGCVVRRAQNGSWSHCKTSSQIYVCRICLLILVKIHIMGQKYTINMVAVLNCTMFVVVLLIYFVPPIVCSTRLIDLLPHSLLTIWILINQFHVVDV